MSKAKNREAASRIERVPEGAHGWIQWKGTGVCMDIHCVCGLKVGHVDAEFCYSVKCTACGRVYHCSGYIELIELEETPDTCVVDTE